MADESPLLTVQRLRKEVEQQRRLRELEMKCGIVFYKPHYKQDLFHRADARRRYVRTGNRFGKSTCGAAEVVAWALGYRPWYLASFDVLDEHGVVRRHHDGVRDAWMAEVSIPQHSTKGLIIVADWDKAEEIFTCQEEGQGRGKLFKLLPESEILGVEKNQSGRVAKILVRSKWGGTSAIHLDTVKSFKSNPMGHESSDWDYIHIDEPCPEEMWKAHSRGLIDRGGYAWFLCTPLTEMWMNDYFLPQGNIRDEFGDKPMEDKAESKWMLTGSMHDNPTLTARAKADFINTLTSEEKETRVDGRPRLLTGVIYREFQPDKHIYRNVPHGWADFNEPPANYTIRVAVDTHPKNNHAALFAATSPSGHTFFYDELYDHPLIDEYCDMIRQRLNGRTPHKFLLELAAFNEDPIQGVSLADVFVDKGFPIEKATKDLSFGIMRVKAELEKTDPNGVPWLLFSPYLTETLREFDRYVWADNGKPLDRDDHMMEDLYRLVLTGLDYVEPEAYRAPVVKPLDLSRTSFMMPQCDLRLPGDAPKKRTREQRYPATPRRFALN